MSFNLTKTWATIKGIRSVGEVIPAVMAIVTQHDRELIDPVWSDQLFTHNVFRVYEMIFGRRAGVRAEATVVQVGEMDALQTVHFFHTFEAAVAHFESWLRSKIPVLVPVKMFVPATAGGFGELMPSPYLFAIAYGAGTNQDYNGQSTGNLTSPTVAGTNTLGIVGLFGQTDLSSYSSTWNGSSCTSIAGINGASANERMEAFYRIAPTAGATTIVGTRGGASNDFRIYGAYYTGAKQSGQPDASSTIDTTTATLTMTLTTIAANCMMMCWIRGTNGSAYSGGTNTTVRLNQNVSIVLADTGATVLSAGSNNIQITSTSQQGFGPFWSIAPAAAAAAPGGSFLLNMV